jgi:putative nucleotidyltransferase with HDIG domain
MDNLKPPTVLFVDDEKTILNLASDFFGRRGYRTLTAENGIEAVALLEREAVDCCFTDINMPRMNGLHLAEKIHAIDSTMPVVVMTGYPSIENAIQTIRNGVVDFLVKPINLKDMEVCLQRVLRQREIYIENLLLKQEVQGKERLETLNRELVQRIEELHTLNRIMGNFSRINSTQNVFSCAVDTVLEILGADQVYFHVVNDAVPKPFPVAAAAAAGDARGARPRPLPAVDEAGGGAEDPAASATDLNRVIMEVVSDEIPLLISENRSTFGLPEHIGSLMAAPLKIRDQIFGVLTAALFGAGEKYTEKDLYYLAFLARSAADSIENLALYENIYDNLFATLYAFVNALEARDLYTREHSNRVTGLSLIIGRELGCPAEELEVLNFAGHLHDIGKIGIRDAILLKPGRLSDSEFEKIKEHPIIGANILEQMGLWENERRIIRSHHERFDGMGYPDGLKGDQIPFLARILTVADVYDAMASDRSYRKRMEESLILEIIRGGAGTQFDPKIVEAFDRSYRSGTILHYMKHGRL